MSARASTSRSHGCTPREAQPPSVRPVMTSKINLRMETPLSLGSRVQQLLERGFVFGPRGFAKADVGVDEFSIAIEYIRARHSFHLELRRQVAGGIENDVERNRHVAQEAIRATAMR